MSASLRITSLAIASVAAAGLALPAATAASAAVSRPSAPTHPAAAAAKPGRTANPIVLDNNVELSGYDAATGPNGNTYIGWISDKNNAGRKVHLCTLPPGSTKCKDGIQTIDSLGDSSAEGLRVLVNSSGEVTLVWMHDTVASESGPMGSEIATASSDGNGVLDTAVDLAAAPSFGDLLDARTGPGDDIWVVMQRSSGSGLLINADLNNPSSGITVLKTPYTVGGARLRFHGNQAVIAIQKAGAITVPVSYASENNGRWSSFHTLAHTWTSDATLGLAGTTSGIRLVTSVNNADYYPVVWSWNGSSFGQPTPTGDHNSCSPASHDLVADGSGRLADVSRECDDVAIANLPDTRHAAVTRFNVHGTFAGGDPQLTTSPRGKGWVAWSIESTVANKLLAAPILLPGEDISTASKARGNWTIVTGPQSCLPPVDVAVGVGGKPASGWRVTSKALKLGNTTLHSNTLNGASLTAGNTYHLTGTVQFANGSSHVTVSAQLTFKSCPNGGSSG